MLKKLAIITLFILYFFNGVNAQTKIYLPIIIKPYQLKIAFIGDSYTLGASDEIKENGYGFAGYIEKELNIKSKRFVYYHFADTFQNWQQIKEFNPDIIVLELGIHSINGCDESNTIEEFRIVVDELIKKSLLLSDNVIYVGIPWRNIWTVVYNKKAQEFNLVLIELSKKYNIKYVNTYDDILNCALECVGYDINHPNDKGHNIIAKNIIEELQTQ